MECGWMVGGRSKGKSADEPRVRDIIPDFVAIAWRHERQVTLFIIPRDKHICASLLCRAGLTPLPPDRVRSIF